MGIAGGFPMRVFRKDLPFWRVFLRGWYGWLSPREVVASFGVFGKNSGLGGGLSRNLHWRVCLPAFSLFLPKVAAICWFSGLLWHCWAVMARVLPFCRDFWILSAILSGVSIVTSGTCGISAENFVNRYVAFVFFLCLI